MAYTRVSTNALDNREMYAVSVYPQLTLYPPAGGRIAARAPRWAKPYFFVRALGPSYISEDKLGEREQDNHLSFLAQIGAGVHIGVGEGPKIKLNVSWRHFSNANLFSENDGFDVPFVLSIGARVLRRLHGRVSGPSPG